MMHLDKNFLQDVFGIQRIAQGEKRSAIHQVLVLVEEQGKGVLVTGLAAAEKCQIQEKTP